MHKRRILTVTIIVSAIYVALMTVFTFYDYQITDGLFNRGTLFGKIFESIGPTFMPFFMMYSVISLFSFLKFKKKTGKVFAYIGLGFSLLYACFMGVMTHKHSYAYWTFIPSIIVYASFMVLSFYINKKIKGMDEDFQRLHVSIILVMFITASVSLMGVDIIKSIFGRVRYLNLSDASLFKPWYYINSVDFNSSFPSGHVSRAMTAICFSLIPLYFKENVWHYVVEVLAVVFAVIVSVSRLLEGMHYPTDVLTGAYLTFIAFYISKYCFIDKKW